MDIQPVFEALKAGRDRGLALLFEFLRFPTVSAQSAHDDDLRRCAGWLVELARSMGVEATLLETGRHPAVYAETGPADGPATVLVYGHYDVQPVGDEASWASAPFAPEIRDGAIYARGAADDKGQLLTHLLAVQAWRAVHGDVPIRVKFLIEGEEEIGSPNLGALVRAQRERLACDYIAISDTAKVDATTPGLTVSTRGLVYKQITVRGPKKDLHSGVYGGTITNPLNALARILGALRDDRNRVSIRGFYDDVRVLSEAERQALNARPFDEAAFLASTGAPGLIGEAGYTTVERRGVRPTLDVNGVLGGYTGEGASTVIPATAMAKVSMRLVVDQDPARISRCFDAAVRAATPAGVDVAIETLSECGPYEAPPDSPGVRAALRAIEAGYGQPAGIIREGATLPILPLFKAELGADSLLLGFCQTDCNAHGANEFFHVADLWAGARSVAALWAELAGLVR
jgi:acetylornithine deacetylase/succinyl-diaminopimelate desuccinylase-like protein